MQSALCRRPGREAPHREDWTSATLPPVRRVRRWINGAVLTLRCWPLKVRNMVSNHWCFVSVLMKRVPSKMQECKFERKILRRHFETKLSPYRSLCWQLKCAPWKQDFRLMSEAVLPMRQCPPVVGVGHCSVLYSSLNFPSAIWSRYLIPYHLCIYILDNICWLQGL